MHVARAGDLAALDRLRAEEAALDLQVEEARRAAAAQAAEARAEADRIGRDAAGALARELSELDSAARADRDAAIAAARAETARSGTRLRVRAARRREAAIALVLAALDGKEPR
jgi:hypothetical protein